MNTKSKAARRRLKPTAQAIEAAGGVSALARALGIKRQAVSQWKHIPEDRRKKIAKLTGIPVELLA